MLPLQGSMKMGLQGRRLQGRRECDRAFGRLSPAGPSTHRSRRCRHLTRKGRELSCWFTCKLVVVKLLHLFPKYVKTFVWTWELEPHLALILILFQFSPHFVSLNPNNPLGIVICTGIYAHFLYFTKAQRSEVLCPKFPRYRVAGFTKTKQNWMPSYIWILHRHNDFIWSMSHALFGTYLYWKIIYLKIQS